MSLKIGLQVKGTYYRDLSHDQKTELLEQIPGLKNDLDLYEYRFHKTKFHKWMIVNAWCRPISFTSVSGRRIHG